VLGVFADKHGDRQERSGTTEIPEIALVRRRAGLLDVGLEVERRPMRVTDPHC
jgi:hypothetical protein